MIPATSVSSAACALAKPYEGCSLTAYWDVNSYSIGRGHKPATQGQTCTQEQADAWFLEDMQEAGVQVLRFVKVPLSQNQLDALADFVYNCGDEDLEQSTLLKLLNGGDYDSVPAQLLRWDNVAGKPNARILQRRKDEGALWSADGSPASV